MIYRKKTVLVDAVEWWPSKTTIPFVDREPGTGRHYIRVNGKRHYLYAGDWILKTVDGELLPPIGAALFEKDYEPVE